MRLKRPSGWLRVGSYGIKAPKFVQAGHFVHPDSPSHMQLAATSADGPQTSGLFESSPFWLYGCVSCVAKKPDAEASLRKWNRNDLSRQLWSNRTWQEVGCIRGWHQATSGGHGTFMTRPLSLGMPPPSTRVTGEQTPCIDFLSFNKLR